MSQHTEDRTVTVLATFGHGEICSTETYTNPANSNRTIVHIMEAGCPGNTTQVDVFEILFKSARINPKHRLWLENPSIFKMCIQTWVNTGISILFPSVGRPVNLRITLPGMETTSMNGDPFGYFPPIVGMSDVGAVGSSGIWNIDNIPIGITRYVYTGKSVSLKNETTIGNIISKFSGSIYPTDVQIGSAIIFVKRGIDRMKADLDDRMNSVKPIELYNDFKMDDTQVDLLKSYINIKYPTNYDTVTLPNRSVTYQLICRGESINLRTPETPAKLELLRSRSDNKVDEIEIYAQSVLSESSMLSDMLRYIPDDQLDELKKTFLKIKQFRELNLDEEDTRILDENLEAKMISKMATATGLEEEMKQLKPFSEEPGTSKGGMRRKTRRRRKKSKRRHRKFYSKKRKS
jgi:hypothetical protein